MAKVQISKILPVALTLVVIAVAIAALVTFARIIFFSGDSPTTKTGEVDTSRDSLLSSAVGRSVIMKVRGNILADESFRSYQIQVSPSKRILTSYKGYLEQPTVVSDLENNIPAYEQFVYALDKANYVKGIEFTELKNDLRGICATGYVYEFQILNYDKVVKNLWTSTCSGSRGSFAASVDQVTNLFFTQIPGSRSLISKIWQ